MLSRTIIHLCINALVFHDVLKETEVSVNPICVTHKGKTKCPSQRYFANPWFCEYKLEEEMQASNDQSNVI